MELLSHLTFFTRFDWGYKEASIVRIFKTGMTGTMPHGTALIGKDSSPDSFHLVLWNESRCQKVCMDGSILAAKSQWSCRMRTNHTNVHDVMNPTKPKSTYWNVITLVLTRDDMILSIPWWRRYDLTTYAPSKKYLPSVSGPGLNLRKQLYQTWAVSTSHNVNYFERRLLTKNALVGIWQWEGTSVSTGTLQYLQIDTLRRTMIKENLGYVRLSCCCGTLLTRCGSITMMCYMIRNLKYLVPCKMLRLRMWSLRSMRRWIRIGTSAEDRWYFDVPLVIRLHKPLRSRQQWLINARILVNKSADHTSLGPMRINQYYVHLPSFRTVRNASLERIESVRTYVQTSLLNFMGSRMPGPGWKTIKSLALIWY